MIRYWLVLLYHSLRYVRAKRRNRTLRLKIDDFTLFSANLRTMEIPIVVLRWWDAIPLTTDEKKQYKDDVDCLINENDIWPIIKLAAKHPGGIKVDLYGICGRNGTSYKGLPYYPPTLAQKIYQSRIWNNGFFIPSGDVYKLSFIYHVVYHKGTDAGISFDQSDTAQQSNKFHKELLKLGESDLSLKSAGLTLLDMHEYLKKHGWSMPVDLMSRWRGNKEVIAQFKCLEEDKLSKLAKKLKGLVVFIIREDAYIGNSIDLIRSMLAERFNILLEHQLSTSQSDAIMTNTRGGNWIEKRKKLATKPTELWVCKPKTKTAYVSKKMNRKYPLIDNFEVLIKREIRQRVNGIDDVKRVVIHASDNDIESAIIFNSAFNEKIDDELRKLQLLS